MPKTFLMISAAGLALAMGSAHAQKGYYVAVTGGFANFADSENSGSVNRDFQIELFEDGGLRADGTPTFGPDVGLVGGNTRYNFETDFELGGFAAVAIGRTTPFGPFRSELEFSITRANIDHHGKFSALGDNLDGLDASALLGAPRVRRDVDEDGGLDDTDPQRLGISVGRVLEDGQGSVTTYSAMVNGYYDIPLSAERVKPYVGVGLGVTTVGADFSPSGLELVDADGVVTFGYQLMAGIDYDLSERTVFHAGFRYRGASPVEYDAGFSQADIGQQPVQTFDSDLEVEINQFITEIGVRYAF